MASGDHFISSTVGSGLAWMRFYCQRVELFFRIHCLGLQGLWLGFRLSFGARGCGLRFRVQSVGPTDQGLRLMAWQISIQERTLIIVTYRYLDFKGPGRSVSTLLMGLSGVTMWLKL